MDFQSYIKTLNTDVTYIKGVGEKRKIMLNRLSLYNVWDIIYNFPKDYEDRRTFVKICDAKEGERCCIRAILSSFPMQKRIKKNIVLCALPVNDGTGVIFVKWFSNPKYPVKFDLGAEYIFYGKVTRNFGKLELEMLEAERADNAKNVLKIIPVYHLTKGVTQKFVRDTVKNAFDKFDMFYDIFDDFTRERYSLCSLDFALRQMHFPSDFETLAKARERLVFEELFILQLSLLYIRKNREQKVTERVSDISYKEEFEKTLPFTLTGAQQNVLNEVLCDLQTEKCANRLIQGDVGSGKTVIAAAAMYVCAKNGFQSALMAPTEILAVQHYETLKKMFGGRVNICLLTSSTKGKKKLCEAIENGEFDVIVGTHALLNDNVKIPKLILAVTDEQHRFGVNQRSVLSAKTKACNVLVMSATPIPRTLALILYGDLDISIVNSMPKGRQKIDTFCVNESYRKRAYSFVEKEIEKGRQAYIVCPLIDENENLDVMSGEKMFAYLTNDVFPTRKIGLLHGKMKADEKDKVMQSFKNGELDILVSTTVIEVGVDVPNATIMLIENAERFGLSQLHQLRGRVGRGEHKSYCILFCNALDNEKTAERMKIMVKSSDGFEIAKKDLELRGFGEFFGTRQHGLPTLKVANLFTDLEILKHAQKLCYEVLPRDPNLKHTQNRLIFARIKALFDKFDGRDIFN